MDNSKKYKKQGASPYPHIGNLIRKKIKEKHLTYAEVSRRIGVNASVLQVYFKQESVQLGVLWNIGVAIEYNFFADLMEYLPQKALENNLSRFQISLKERENEIVDLKKEIEIYKSILRRD